MKNRLVTIGFTVALLALAAASSARAGDVILDGFTMPSGNVACLYSNENGTIALRCDIREMTPPPPQPSSCRFEWGHAFEMGVRGPVERLCTDDHTFDPGLEDLDYGKTWQRDGFSCRSERSGVTCVNADQHGFTLSRGEQRVF